MKNAPFTQKKFKAEIFFVVIIIFNQGPYAGKWDIITLIRDVMPVRATEIVSKAQE